MKKVTILYILVMCAWMACRTEIEPDIPSGKNLCPQDPGREIIYQVDSIVYDDYKLRPDNKPDSFSYQLREWIDSRFTDNIGKINQRVFIYKRLNDSFNWEPYKTVTTIIDDQGFQRMEDNIRTLKLVFPVSLKKSWNGNAYNTLGPQNFQYTEIYKSAFPPDSLVIVQQANDSNFVEKHYAMEVYRTQIGMVYGQYDSIYYQSYNPTTQRYYWKGLLYRKKMISHNP